MNTNGESKTSTMSRRLNHPGDSSTRRLNQPAIANANNNSTSRKVSASGVGAEEEIKAILETHELLSEGLEGVDVMVGINDCCCKTPLIEALRRQCSLLSKEKENHENTRVKGRTLEQENLTLKGQVAELYKAQESKDEGKQNLQNQLLFMTSSVKAAQEAQKNAEILQERLKAELVKKHGDAAHETQLKNKFSTDIDTLEKQNEELHKQVEAYDSERLIQERARMEEQTKRMEVEGRLRIVEARALKEKEDDANLIEALEEQVTVATNARLRSEQESRAAKAALQNANISIKTIQKEMESLVESHGKEVAEMRNRLAELKDRNLILDRQMAQKQKLSDDDLKKTESAKLELNKLLLRATKEISHLDKMNEDLDLACRALKEETTKLKNEKDEIYEKMSEAEEKFAEEKNLLQYEVDRLAKSNAMLDDQVSEANVKMLGLESDIRRANQMIELKGVEIEDLTNLSEKRIEGLNISMKGSTEKLHAEIAFLKNALREKVLELQDIKCAIQSAGGDLTLLPIDQRDHKKLLEQMDALRLEKESAEAEVERLSRLSKTLEGEKEMLNLKKTSIIEQKDKTVTEMNRRNTGLLDEIDHRKASINTLREKYEHLEGRYFHEQSEKQKLANVLKKHMNVAMPQSKHAAKRIGGGGGGGSAASGGGGSMSGSGSQVTSKGNSRNGSRSALQVIPENEYLKEDDDVARHNSKEMDKTNDRENVISSTDGSGLSDRDSLEAIKQKVIQAKKFHLHKGLGESLKEEGVKMTEFEDLAAIYDEHHMDFEALLDELIKKANTYRMEKVDALMKVKELKVRIHFLEMELEHYKELEESLMSEGLVDKDALKAMKVEAVKKITQRGIPEEADQDVKDFFAKKSGEQYAKESLTKMKTLFADQKHILDRAEDFGSFQDLLEALRQDITVETQNLKREIEDIIKLVDEMKGAKPRQPENSNANQNSAAMSGNNANANQNCANNVDSRVALVESIYRQRRAVGSGKGDADYANEDAGFKGRGFDVKESKDDVKEPLNVSLVSLSSDVSSRISGIPKGTMTRTKTKASANAPRLPSIQVSSKESLALDRARDFIVERSKIMADAMRKRRSVKSDERVGEEEETMEEEEEEEKSFSKCNYRVKKDRCSVSSGSSRTKDRKERGKAKKGSANNSSIGDDEVDDEIDDVVDNAIAIFERRSWRKSDDEDVENSEGFRRRRRRNRREQGGFEDAAAEDKSEDQSDDQLDGHVVEVLKQHYGGGSGGKKNEHQKWRVDGRGRGWRTTANGQRLMLDEEGREWTLSLTEEGVAYRREEVFGGGVRTGTLGQKWMLEVNRGLEWLVDSQRRLWRVDADGNLRMRDSMRKEKMIIDKHGKQWIDNDVEEVDEDFRRSKTNWRSKRSRAAEVDEEIVVPFEVRRLLHRSWNNAVAIAAAGAEFDEKVKGKKKREDGRNRKPRPLTQNMRDRRCDSENVDSDGSKTFLTAWGGDHHF